MKVVGYYLNDGTFVALKPDDKIPEYLIECPACGVWVDCRSLDDVMQHFEKGHPRPESN